MDRHFSLSVAIILSLSFFASSALAQTVWSPVATHVPARPQFLSPSRLCFPVADTGFLILETWHADRYKDSLVRTTDGGLHWSPVILPVAADSIAYMDISFYGNEGWLMLTLGRNRHGKLLKTTDYASNWTPLPFDSMLSPASIYFKNESLGFMSAASQNGLNDSLRMTTDGGITWRVQSALGLTMWGNPMFWVGEANVILRTIPVELGYTYSISTDSGATWNGAQPTRTPMRYIGNCTWITYNARTTDDGTTWMDAPTTATYADVIVTDTLGHAIYRPQISPSPLFFTGNFGLSWDSTGVAFEAITDGTITKGASYVLAADDEGTYTLYRSSAKAAVHASHQLNGPQLLENPVSRLLKVTSSDYFEGIRIIDNLGRTIQSRPLLIGLNEFDISQLPDGSYWLVTRAQAIPFIHRSE